MNTRFIDLPESLFPFTIETIDTDTQEVLWTETVEGPGGLRVPSKPPHVREITIKVTYGDGVVAYSPKGES